MVWKHDLWELNLAMEQKVSLNDSYERDRERMEREGEEENRYLQTAGVTQMKKVKEEFQKIMHSKDNSLRKRWRHKGVCLGQALLKLKDY